MAERGRLHMTMADYTVIAAGILLGIFGGIMGQIYQIGPEAELYTRYVVALSVFAALYCIYQARSSWGGDLARYLEIIGVGFILFMLLWVPHIEWHIKQMPTIFGLSRSFILGFFHTMTASTFLIAAYGFYRFWQED